MTLRWTPTTATKETGPRPASRREHMLVIWLPLVGSALASTGVALWLFS